MVVWEVETNIENLNHMKDDIRRHGFSTDNISMADIVPWETMTKAKNLATGPGRGSLKSRLPWTTCLKIFIEVRILQEFNTLRIILTICRSLLHISI